MKKKYKEFAEKFEQLCEEYKDEDFEVVEVMKICEDIVQNYSN